MTRFDPTLIVERMRIDREGTPVYDEQYHRGVNVIHGENSSGKSTILNFIFYGLGGDLFDWSAAAQLCSRVLLQVRINGDVATLSRMISDKPRQSMDIFAGEIDRALLAPAAEWLRFSYTRSDTRESFSQVLFRLLNVPEAASDASGNITVNQVLRLLYADQLSPIETIFKYQGVFDDPSLRDAVGRLLFGAHSALFYQNQQEIRRLNKELDELTGEYRSLLAVAGEAGEGFTYEWVQVERQKLEQEGLQIAAEITTAEREIMIGGAADNLTLTAQTEAYAEVVNLQDALSNAQEARDNLALKIADSERFILILKNKLEALQDSSRVAEAIGQVRFSECPACHAAIEESLAHDCYLCKTPFQGGQERGRITALINDTALQIAQSETLQKSRERQARQLDEEIARLLHKWRVASERLEAVRSSVTSDRQQQLRELNRQAGYIERQRDDLRRMEQLAKRLQDLSDRRADLRGYIAKLEGDNEALERQQQERIARASTAVGDEIKKLLINDLRRQDIFENPRSVTFSFRENSISVNEERYFSASSRAILKSSFTLGFLAAATKLPFMRHPRFCMIDTLENMGVEAIRSRNFQRQILRVSRESEIEHQIIFATAMIDTELDSELYVVGRKYTRDEPSLSLIS